MDKEHLNNLPELMGGEISTLAQKSEHKDLGFCPFCHSKIASGCRRWESDNQQSPMATELLKYEGLGQ